MLCWGLTPVLLRQLTESIDAWSANGFRYPMAAILFWPVLVWGFRTKRITGSIVLRCLIPGMFALAGQIFWAMAPYYLPATSIGFFVRMSVAWALLGAMLFFAEERLLLRRFRFYLGMLLNVGGFLMLASTKTMGVEATGVLVISICSFFFGCYAISVRFLRGIHPLIAFAIVSQLVSVGTITAMFVSGQHDFSRLQSFDWVLMIVSSLLGVGVGHILMYTAVMRLGPSIAGSVQTVSPFVTAALAMAFLGENMKAMEWLSGIVMFSGAIVLVSLRVRSKTLDGSDE